MVVNAAPRFSASPPRPRAQGPAHQITSRRSLGPPQFRRVASEIGAGVVGGAALGYQ